MEKIINNKCQAADKILPGFGKSLVAKDQIQKDQVILAIKKCYFITLTTVYEKEKCLFESLMQIGLSLRSILAFYLNLSKEEYIQSYLSIIPREFTNIITWDDDCIKLLGRRDLIDKFENQKLQFIAEFQAGKSCLLDGEGIIAGSQREKLKNLDWNNYKESIALIQSRTLFFKNNQDPESDVGALIPFYDYCNHKFLPRESNHFSMFYFDDKSEQFILKAYKNYEKDEQIFITYGNHPNIHFLEYYGFLPSENKFDQLQIKIESYFFVQNLEKDQFFQLKLELLSQLLPHLTYLDQESSQFRFNLILNFTILIQPAFEEIQYLITTDDKSKQESKYDTPSVLSWENETMIKVLSLSEQFCIEASTKGPPNQLNDSKNQPKKGSQVQQKPTFITEDSLNRINIDFDFYRGLKRNLKEYLINECFVKADQKEPNSEKEKLAIEFFNYEMFHIESLI